MREQEFSGARTPLPLNLAREADPATLRALYLKRLQAARMAGRVAEQQPLLHALGQLERQMGNPGGALEFLCEEARLLEADNAVAGVLNAFEQGLAHLQTANSAAADARLRTALTRAKACGDTLCLAYAFLGMGERFNAQRESRMARHYYGLSLLHFQKAGQEKQAEALKGKLEGLEAKAQR